MNWTCLFGHRWDGCRCIRCDTLRNRDHAWHYCRCARCGSFRHTDHHWVRCICLECKIERHQWVAGVCAACQRVCQHEPPAYLDPADGAPGSLHPELGLRCWRCGLPEPLWDSETPPNG